MKPHYRINVEEKTIIIVSLSFEFLKVQLKLEVKVRNAILASSSHLIGEWVDDEMTMTS